MKKRPTAVKDTLVETALHINSGARFAPVRLEEKSQEVDHDAPTEDGRPEKHQESSGCLASDVAYRARPGPTARPQPAETRHDRRGKVFPHHGAAEERVRDVSHAG